MERDAENSRTRQHGGERTPLISTHNTAARSHNWLSNFFGYLLWMCIYLCVLCLPVIENHILSMARVFTTMVLLNLSHFPTISRGRRSSSMRPDAHLPPVIQRTVSFVAGPSHIQESALPRFLEFCIYFLFPKVWVYPMQ